MRRYCSSVSSGIALLKKTETTESSGHGDQPLDEGPAPARRAFEPTVTPHQIEKAFAALPIAFTTVILLVDVQGLSYKEVAAALDVRIGTVRSRLHRGRRELRQRLAPPSVRIVHSRDRS